MLSFLLLQLLFVRFWRVARRLGLGGQGKGKGHLHLYCQEGRESAACEASGFCPVSWPQWSRFCPVPRWLGAQWPGLFPWERQAGHQSRWARTEAKQRPSSAPSQGGALATSHGPKATQEPWPQGHSGRAPPTSMEPWVESGIVSGVATPGVQFLSRASPGWREGWGWGWGWGWGLGGGEGWGWAWCWAWGWA